MKPHALMTAAAFYHGRAHDGRAVIRYHPMPDSHGLAQPALWLCLIGRQLFACDDEGPEHDAPDAPDLGFLVPVRTTERVYAIVRRWRRHVDTCRPTTSRKPTYVIKAAHVRGRQTATQVAPAPRVSAS